MLDVWSGHMVFASISLIWVLFSLTLPLNTSVFSYKWRFLSALIKFNFIYTHIYSFIESLPSNNSLKNLLIIYLWLFLLFNNCLIWFQFYALTCRTLILHFFRLLYCNFLQNNSNCLRLLINNLCYILFCNSLSTVLLFISIFSMNLMNLNALFLFIHLLIETDLLIYFSLLLI